MSPAINEALLYNLANVTVLKMLLVLKRLDAFAMGHMLQTQFVSWPKTPMKKVGGKN